MKKLIVLFMALFIMGIFFACAQTERLRPDTSKFEIIGELGAASATNLKGRTDFGYSVAFEITPIENWLELEIGVSPVFSAHSKETDIDLLFKKPWTFSPKVEFMIGAGPVWTHETSNSVSSNGVSGEAAFDLMFWPFAHSRFGYFIEPGYQFAFASGHEQSIGISGGLLIRLP